MLTLRTALPGVGDPWNRVADALAAAGRGWSDYTRPAAAAGSPRCWPRRPHRPGTAEPDQASRAPALACGRPLIAAGVAALLLGRPWPCRG